MRFFSILILLFFIFIICACTRLPQPASYDYSEQQKMQAAHHWDVLAWDVANQINNQLIQSDYIDMAVFVKETCSTDQVPCPPGETTTFNESFHDFLKTRLYEFGVTTRKKPDPKAISVNYKVQVVYHRHERHALQPGFFTAISTAIIVLRDLGSNAQILGIGAGLDLINSTQPLAGHYEIIITTSMVKNNKYLFRTSDVYYVNDDDFWHYQNVANGSDIMLIGEDA